MEKRWLREKTRLFVRRAGAGALAVALLGEIGAPGRRGAAHSEELRALDVAHTRLETLVREQGAHNDRAADAAAMRSGLLDVRSAIEPELSAIRSAAPEPSREVERALDGALSQLDDGGDALAADRSEFVLSALLPLASAITTSRNALLAVPR